MAEDTNISTQAAPMVGPFISTLNDLNDNIIYPTTLSAAVKDLPTAVAKMKAGSADKATAADTATKASTADTATKAASADKLTTARKIAGKDFDGTQDVAIAAGDVGAYTKAEVNTQIANTTKASTVTVQLGFGVTATLRKVGKVVTLDCMTNQTSNRPDGNRHMTEKIPVGYRPNSVRVMSAVVNIGANLQVGKLLYQFIHTDGSMDIFSVNLNASPYTINFSDTWITND